MHSPARGLDDRETGALLDAAYQRRHHEAAAMRRGVCTGCGGRVERDLRPDPADTADTGSDPPRRGGRGAGPRCGQGRADPDSGAVGGCLERFAVLSCGSCRASLVGHPANVALTAPEVVGFLADHGRDAALARWWTDPVAGARAGTSVLEAEPPTVEIPFSIAGEQLRVVLDSDLQVVEAERTVA